MITVEVAGNNYSLDDGTYCRFLGHDGLGAPPTHRYTQRGSLQHGVTDKDFRLDPRIFTLVFEIEGTSLNNMYSKREALLEILQATPSDEPLSFKFAIHENRYIDAFFVGQAGMGWQDKEGFTQRASFVFQAPNPLFYDLIPGASIINLGIGSGYGVIPMPVPTAVGVSAADTYKAIQYSGSWRTSPLVKITGPFTSPVVENLSTQEKLDFTGCTISQGDYYLINPRYGEQSVVNASDVNKISDLSTDSDLATFHLGAFPEVPGSLNSIHVIGSGVNELSKVELYWTHYYLGI